MHAYTHLDQGELNTRRGQYTTVACANSRGQVQGELNIIGGGNRVSVHFAVTFLDCWRTSFCVTTIIKAADLM